MQSIFGFFHVSSFKTYENDGYDSFNTKYRDCYNYHNRYKSEIASIEVNEYLTETNNSFLLPVIHDKITLCDIMLIMLKSKKIVCTMEGFDPYDTYNYGCYYTRIEIWLCLNIPAFFDKAEFIYTPDGDWYKAIEIDDKVKEFLTHAYKILSVIERELEI